MSSREPRLWLQRTRALRGDQRMSLSVWWMLVLVFCGGTKEMVMGRPGGREGWHSYRLEKRQNIIQDFKRHSDGTFSSDFSQYLDKIKAKDFVEWLASTKREGCHQDILHIADEV